MAALGAAGVALAAAAAPIAAGLYSIGRVWVSVQQDVTSRRER